MAEHKEELGRYRMSEAGLADRVVFCRGRAIAVNYEI